MRFTKFLVPTLKEVPADAAVPSHILMLRAGMIRKLASGIYTYLPLGLRTIRKIENIVREEMNRSGAVELLLPMVQPSDLWGESGRWGYYGPELLRFEDRRGGKFCLGPTHEEVITSIVRNEIDSYRDLPLNLYQIQTKFRDEIRPRFGLMRGREFIMKDAYSFDISEEKARESYRIMYDAYVRIFSRLGLLFRAVEAATGAIGGSLSHEFQVLADTGEDVILSCSSCDYAASSEMAECQFSHEEESRVEPPPIEEVATPGAGTIDAVTRFLGVTADKLCKSLLYLADGKPVLAMVRGDHELAESKLAVILGCDDLHLADDATILRLTGSPVGYSGPIGLSEDVSILADNSLKRFEDGVAGANREDTHYIHISGTRDFPERVTFHDLRLAGEGDLCPRCKQGRFQVHRGIETGHVFYLGSKYSERMNACVLDEQGGSVPLVMGCYGIGIGRTMAASIEQNHDENGIIWPFSIAPYEIVVCPVGQDDDVVKTAESLYEELRADGIDVILDDRKVRPGVMFKDADLIGFPLRITVGKKSLAEGGVELKLRREKDARMVAKERAKEEILSILASESRP